MKRKIALILAALMIFSGTTDSLTMMVRAEEVIENAGEATVSASELFEDRTVSESDVEETAVDEICDNEIGSSEDINVLEESSADIAEEEEGLILPTGDIFGTVVEVDFEEALDEGLVDLSDETAVLSGDEVVDESKDSAIYNTEWDKYSTNYYYNNLSSSQKKLWDTFDKQCRGYLNGTANTGEYTPLVCTGSTLNSWNEAVDVLRLFRYSNPQYYFLSSGYMRSWSYKYGEGFKYYTGICIYEKFQNGAKRKTATQQFKSVITTYESMLATCKTDEDKVRKIHDLICNNVEYNYDAIEYGADDEVHLSQTAYSALVMDSTVCAGYAMAFELLANGQGIDTVCVTSDDHQWNKVRVNSIWSNIDTTWADQDTYIYYEYYEKSDANYKSGNSSHKEESLWTGVSPSATVNSTASGRTYGTIAAPTRRVATPVVNVELKSGKLKVTMECSTPGAVIYYTTDGNVPSPGQSKSAIYKKAITVSKKSDVKAVAVLPGYLDSNIGEETSYAVNYVLNGGENSSSNPVAYKCSKGTVTLKSPTRKGYTFNGWYLEPTFDTKVKTLSKSNVTNGMYLYAKWTPYTFYVKYNSNGSKAVGKMPSKDTIVYQQGNRISENVYTRVGYDFIGWNTKSKGTGTAYADKADISQDYYKNKSTVYLYAQWRAHVYTIKLNGNGADGGSTANITASYGTSYKLTNGYTRTGYTFAGWSVTPSGKTQDPKYPDNPEKLIKAKTYKNKESVKNLASDQGAVVNLYAQWKLVDYSITYNLNKGKLPTGTIKKYNVTTDTFTLAEPTRKGYVFDGWYLDSKFKNKLEDTVIEKGSTGNIKVYAKWSKVK